jgi:hypothetical protein
MTHPTAFLAALALPLMLTNAVNAACPAVRSPVKTATDTQASQVRLNPVFASIESLRALPAPRPLPQDTRVSPAETTIYVVTATLIAYRLTAESEVELILADDLGRSVIASLPAPACATGSPFLSAITTAREAFERKYQATGIFQDVRQPVEVQGIGFFDFLQGTRGQAPNGIALHPVTSINFFPLFPPRPPAPSAGRRRSVGVGGGRICPRPSLSITASRASVCATEPVTISWNASDSAASVSIDGIGASLPPSGSRSVTSSVSSAFSGRASTSCGAGDEAVAVVNVTPLASASISGPSSMSSGTNTTLIVTVTGVGSWTASSALGNTISPSSGNATQGITYTASRTGLDTVTLRTSAGCGGEITKTMTISISTPATRGLRCCDQTFSPTCFSCADKRGCCSSHGGVCGCQ